MLFRTTQCVCNSQGVHYVIIYTLLICTVFVIYLLSDAYQILLPSVDLISIYRN
jgi:hypothetical protein